MVKDLVQYLYTIAKEHKLIRGFKYDQITKGMGTGEDMYPLLFVEDPIFYNYNATTAGTCSVNVNIDVLFLPQSLENYDVEQLNPLDCQNLAHSVILNILARIRHDAIQNDSDVTVRDYSLLTLRHWGDDDASGMRISMKLTVKNDIYLCDIDEHFDTGKTLDVQSILSDISTDDAEGCSASFGYKLPNISL